MPWPGVDLGRAAESAGAAAFCSGEFVGHNAYMTAVEMAQASTSAMVGTGIAYAFARSPFVHAASVRQLNSLAPDRVFLGLGAGTARMNAQWFGVDASEPAARMGELVEVIRTYLHAENGSRIRYTGRFYDVDANIQAPVLGRIDVPILIGAFNRHMIRTVGRTADGIIGHSLFTDRWWTEVVAPELDRGAQQTGRDPGSLHRWGWLTVAIDDEDPARAIVDAKRQIAFYCSVKTYDALFDLHGWADDVRKIRTAFYQNDPRIDTYVTDDMLWSLTVCGDSTQARQMLDERKQLPDLGFLAPPGFLVSSRRRDRYAAATMDFCSTYFETKMQPLQAISRTEAMK
jgi:5,10-methylenetetrahydromethanopterin reductase